MRIALGSDHAGYQLKTAVAKHLVDEGHEVIDLGTDSEEVRRLPVLLRGGGRSVVAGDADFGIVIGGSGQGEQIAANKVHGVRAALCVRTSSRLASPGSTTTRTFCRLGAGCSAPAGSCDRGYVSCDRGSREGVTSVGSDR